jgi:hypothetical protein
MQALFEETNLHRVREMHLGALTPQAVGFPVAPLFAVPATSSAVNDGHMRDVFEATRDRLDNVLRQRAVAGAKYKFSIVYTSFDGAYARVLKPVYAMTRKVDDLTILDFALPLFLQPLIGRIAQKGRKLLADDKHQVKAMRYHFVSKAGSLLVWLADDRTSVVIDWKTMVFIGVHPWLMIDDGDGRSDRDGVLPSDAAQLNAGDGRAGLPRSGDDQGR